MASQLRGLVEQFKIDRKMNSASCQKKDAWPWEPQPAGKEPAERQAQGFAEQLFAAGRLQILPGSRKSGLQPNLRRVGQMSVSCHPCVDIPIWRARWLHILDGDHRQSGTIYRTARAVTPEKEVHRSKRPVLPSTFLSRNIEQGRFRVARDSESNSITLCSGYGIGICSVEEIGANTERPETATHSRRLPPQPSNGKISSRKVQPAACLSPPILLVRQMSLS
jgi:hypothetical protein